MGKTTFKEKTMKPRNILGLPPASIKIKKGPALPSKTDLSLKLSGNLSLIPAPKKHEDDLPKKLTKMKSFLSQVRKYCANTTLHGLRYVGDAYLTYGERIFWFTSFALAVGFAGYYISNIYTKWNSSPVYISFSPFDTDLSTIPFPAITICNMNQAKKNESLAILREGSDLERKLLDDFCYRNATFNKSETIDWKTQRDFLMRVGSSCSDILLGCTWGNKKVNCSSIFINELTDEGLCCIFNRLPPKMLFRNWKNMSVLNQSYSSDLIDWDAESGYGDAKDGQDDFIPRRPEGTGAHMGLSVAIDAQVDNYFCSSTRSTGFKMTLSDPLEKPQVAGHGLFISPGFETRVSIEPNVKEAMPTLRNIPIEKRQCFFSNERPLSYYRKYTLGSCRVECQSHLILKKCGCIPYYLPRNYSINVCRRNDECAQNIIDSTQKKLLLESNSEHKLNKSQSNNCNCYPRCFKIDYSFSMASCPLKIFKKSRFSEQFIRDNIGKVLVYFETADFAGLTKMPLYNFTDLLAYTGGLLGFFIGFSLLSVVEIFFHMTWLWWKEYIINNYKKPVKTSKEPSEPTLYPFIN